MTLVNFAIISYTTKLDTNNLDLILLYNWYFIVNILYFVYNKKNYYCTQCCYLLILFVNRYSCMV